MRAARRIGSRPTDDLQRSVPRRARQGGGLPRVGPLQPALDDRQRPVGKLISSRSGRRWLGRRAWAQLRSVQPPRRERPVPGRHGEVASHPARVRRGELCLLRGHLRWGQRGRRPPRRRLRRPPKPRLRGGLRPANRDGDAALRRALLRDGGRVRRGPPLRGAGHGGAALPRRRGPDVRRRLVLGGRCRRDRRRDLHGGTCHALRRLRIREPGARRRPPHPRGRHQVLIGSGASPESEPPAARVPHRGLGPEAGELDGAVLLGLRGPPRLEAGLDRLDAPAIGEEGAAEHSREPVAVPQGAQETRRRARVREGIGDAVRPSEFPPTLRGEEGEPSAPARARGEAREVEGVGRVLRRVVAARAPRREEEERAPERAQRVIVAEGEPPAGEVGVGLDQREAETEGLHAGLRSGLEGEGREPWARLGPEDEEEVPQARRRQREVRDPPHQVEDDRAAEPLDRERRMAPEPGGAHPLRPNGGGFLRVGEQEGEVVREGRTRATDRVGDREEDRDAARVVVGAGPDPSADDAEVIVVREEGGPTRAGIPGAPERSDVRPVSGPLSGPDEGRLLEQPVEERPESRPAQPGKKVLPRERVSSRAALSPLELRRGEPAHVRLDRRGIHLEPGAPVHPGSARGGRRGRAERVHESEPHGGPPDAGEGADQERPGARRSTGRIRLRTGRTVALLLLATLAPQAPKRPPTFEEMVERVRREGDLVPDDLLHQIAVFQDEAAFGALDEFHGLLATAAKRRQVVHEYRHFAKTPLADRAIARLAEVGRTSGDEAEGREAVGALATYEEAAAEALRSIAKESAAPSVRLEAIAKLVPHRKAEDFPLFLELARAEGASAVSRAAGIRAIGPDERGEEAVRRALSEPSSTVRGAAREAIAKRRDPAAIALARGFAADPKMKEWSPCVGAIAVLREEKGKGDAELLFAIGSRTEAGIRALARKALQEFDAREVVPPAAAALAGKDRGAAIFALDVLEKFPHPDAGRCLRGALESPDPAVVAAAATALGARGEAEAVSDLRKKTANADPAARAAVIGALSDLLPQDADWRRRLQQFADERDREVRVAAALALGRHAGAEGLPTLERLLADRDVAVRVAATEGLATGRLKAAIPILVGRLKKEKGRLREDLAAALRRITGEPFGREPGDWERWWAGEGARFSVPSLADVEARAGALAKARAEARTATFYGVEFLSERAVFVLDASGSMAERTGTAAPGGKAESRYEVALRELRRALEGRRGEEGIRFNLVLFAANADAWHEKMQPLDERSIDLAVGFASHRAPAGGTNVHDALARAFEDPDVDTIYLLSDGEPSAGPVKDPSLLRTEVRGWNRYRRIVVHGISIGTSSALLEGLAADSGGKFVKR